MTHWENIYSAFPPPWARVPYTHFTMAAPPRLNSAVSPRTRLRSVCSLLGNVANTHDRPAVCEAGSARCTNSYTSPMVCVVLKRAGSRVPSGRATRIVSVGWDSSIVGVVVEDAAAVVAVVAAAGTAPEIGALGAVAAEVGLPSRRPSPEKGRYTRGSWCQASSCWCSLTSTACPNCTFIRCSGARPCRIMARSAALLGSSKRCSGPSSMLKPSCQICRTRSCTSSEATAWPGRGAPAVGRPDGSGMSRDSTPSPPSVCPAPQEREDDGSAAGPGSLS